MSERGGKSIWLRSALAAGLVLWLGLNIWYIHAQIPPWEDSWCYLGPATVSSAPWLTTPLIELPGQPAIPWSLHWPGVPGVWSWLIPRGSTPLVWVGVQVLGWSCLLLAAANLLRSLSVPLWIWLWAPAVLAFDRVCLLVVGYGRVEVFAAAVALWAVTVTIRHLRPSGAGGWALSGAFLLLPLMHPLTTALGFGLLMCLLVNRRPADGRERLSVWIPASTFLAGLGLLAISFLASEARWSSFMDHWQAVRSEYRGGGLPQTLLAFYGPLHTGALLPLAVLGVTVLAWKRRDSAVILLTICSVGAVLLVAMLHNPFYWVVALALLTVCVAAGAEVWRRTGAPWRTTVLSICGPIFLLAHAGHAWVKAKRFQERSFVDIRAQIAGSWNAIPSSPLCIIPPVFWECAVLSGRAVVLNTLPRLASPDARARYERDVLGALRTGDLYLVDERQDPRPSTSLSVTEFEEVGRLEFRWDAARQAEFSITIFRRR